MLRQETHASLWEGGMGAGLECPFCWFPPASSRPGAEKTWPCLCPVSSKCLTHRVVEALNYFDERLPFDLGKCSANLANPISLTWIGSSVGDCRVLFCSRALLCEDVDGDFNESSPEWEEHSLQLTGVPRADLTGHPAPNPGSACPPHQPWSGQIPADGTCSEWLTEGCLSLSPDTLQGCFGFSYSAELVFPEKGYPWPASSLVSVPFLLFKLK